MTPPLHFHHRLATQYPAPLKQPQHPLPHCRLHPLRTSFIHLRPTKHQPRPPLRHHHIQHAQVHMHMPSFLAEQLRDLLMQAGLAVEWVGFRGGHEIPGIVLDKLGGFLRSVRPR